MGIPQPQFARPISSLPMAQPQQQAAATNDPFTSQGGEKKKRVEKEASRSFGLLDQLMSALGAFDAFGNNLAARKDPTIPALTNSMLGTYTNFMNQGGVNANQALSGNYSQNFFQPMTLGGDASSPFNIPLQKPGGNPVTEALFNQLVGPAGTSQISEIARSLMGFGSPNTNRTQQTGPGDISALYAALGLPPPQQGPVLDSFATGTPFVPQTGTYQLHQGEAVIPAQQNPMNPVANPALQPGPTGGLTMPTNITANTRQKGVLGYQPMMPQAAPQPAPLPPAPPPTPTGPINPITDTYTLDPHAGGMPRPPEPTQTPVYGGTPHLAPPTTNPAPTGPANPLQQALQQLQSMLSGGGPINQQVQNTMNQQTADMVSRGQQQGLQDLRANFGARGLGGSGLQYGLEQQMNDSAMRALTEGQNMVGLNAANTNYNALHNVANSLLGGSLGAGQFGLQQAQFNLNQQQSMFDQLLNAIRNSYAPAA